MIHARPYLFCLLVCLPALTLAGPARIDVGRFAAGDLSGWQPKTFKGETRYALASDGERRALHAESLASASGLLRKLDIDLAQTPYLHWSWKVNNVLGNNDERRRGGDDYPARVYVLFSGGLFFWRTRAIDYVWSSNQSPGTTWPNAFTGNARMIAVESGPDGTGRWIDERRDVRADYRRLFGSDPGNADAVAIMTDTDNTGLSASAWYGDIWFDSD